MSRNLPEDIHLCFKCKDKRALFIEAKGGIIKRVMKGNDLTFQWYEYRDPLVVCANCGEPHGSPVTKPD